MNSSEIRRAFLSFFEERGHKVIPSSSLIPHGDPTLLLTTAGMVQFKPYFLGEAIPPSRRLTSCQKCFRTTDIESVGDSKHLTFFEMLGNFSIGDYFKKEAIAWAWEFVTQRLALSPKNLWITIFYEDEEAFHYWREIGVPEPRILRFGEKENFWGPAGNSGPCGPCSEIHYDFGAQVGCGKPTCAPNCDCGRFSEIWNLVFTQYNQDETGQRTLLPRPNIDTGMGLERITAAVNGKVSVYETDLLVPLVKCISDLAGKGYGANTDADNAMRVVAEHSRGISFLIADGVVPSNEGRGYVLRRLLRRTALFGRRLGLDKPFLTETAKAVMELMGSLYPEIVQRREFVLKVIEFEEARFRETIDTGLELIEAVMVKEANRKTKQISGEDAFRLYDTYGFPVELTREIAGEHAFSVDIEGFEKEMVKQRERARASHKFETSLVSDTVTGEQLGIPETAFVGYHTLEQKSVVLSILVNGSLIDNVAEGQTASLILEETPFYGEMGGQIGDTGEIRGASGRFLVTNTVRIPGDVIVHEGKVVEGNLAVGDEVRAIVDRERRLDIARNHTATHLLQAALRQVLGEHVQQRGSLVAPDRLRFDFSHLEAMTEAEIGEVQHIVNEKIRQNLPVFSEETAYERAIEEGAIALFNEKYGNVVRLMKIGRPAVSAELCGGTHVTSTGEIGYFQIISESGIGTGLRRIEAVTGRGAETYFDRRLATLESVAKTLGASAEDVQEKLSDVAAELAKERKRVLALERELAKREAESLVSRAEKVNGVTLLVARTPASSQQVLREMADFLRDKLKSAIIVLGTVYEDKPYFLTVVTPDLVEKGYNAGDIVKQVARVAGGGGGGRASLAQAGGKYKDKVDEALRLARSLIK